MKHVVQFLTVFPSSPALAPHELFLSFKTFRKSACAFRFLRVKKNSSLVHDSRQSAGGIIIKKYAPFTKILVPVPISDNVPLKC